MEQNETRYPISLILDSQNYSQWAYAMKRSIKGCLLWRYINREVPKQDKSEHYFTPMVRDCT